MRYRTGWRLAAKPPKLYVKFAAPATQVALPIGQLTRRVAHPRPAPDQRFAGALGGKPAALADWPAPSHGGQV